MVHDDIGSKYQYSKALSDHVARIKKKEFVGENPASDEELAKVLRLGDVLELDADGNMMGTLCVSRSR